MPRLPHVQLSPIWQQRSFRNLWLGTIVSAFGSEISGVAIPLTAVLLLGATSVQMARLRWELSRVLAPEDALLTVRLCPTCADQIGARNDEDNWPAFHDVCKIVG